jgi:uncharacterized membrane protein
MFKQITGLTAFHWLITILFALLLSDLIIVAEIPVLKQVLPFIFFSLVPGMILLNILGLTKLNFLKKILLGIALSLSILIFTGLLLNIFYPLIKQPLSLLPVLISLNLVTILMAVMEYKKWKNDFYIKNIFNFSLDLDGKLLSPLLFPLIFPLMAILGTYLMNNSLNNIILIAMLFLVPIFLVFIVYLKDKIHPITYPLSIWLIGLGLLLMHGLTSNHIMGRDIHAELYCFQLTLENFHWDINTYYNPYNACLSITILPTIYSVLTSMSNEYIFKIYFSVICSFIPLIVYLVSEKYVGKYAFFAALLFVFQVFFLTVTDASRQGIALIFFFITVMVWFDDSIKLKTRKVLFLILIFSTIVSHYTTSYVALVILMPILFLPFLKSLIREKKLVFTNFDVIICYLVFLVLWFLFYAKVQLFAGSDVLTTTAGVASNSGTLLGGPRSSLVLNVFGFGLKSLPNIISTIVNDSIFLLIALGLLTILFKFKQYLYKIGEEFLLGIIISMSLLLIFLTMPFVSNFYGPERLFFQVLIFIAPLFIIGGFKISKMIKKPHLKPIIFLILLISLFICSNHLQYHFYGIAFSSEYDSQGMIRGENFIYDPEIQASSWLNNYSIPDVNIYADSIGYSRLMLGGNNIKRAKGINFNNITTYPYNGYIYLGYEGTNNGVAYETLDYLGKWEDFPKLFSEKSRIYENAYSRIYYG